MEKSKELKIGAVIAYLTIAINIISSLWYTPWILRQIGDAEYGLYTLSNSLINLVLFDFGLSAATARFVSKYLAEKRQDKVDDVLGVIYKLYFIIDAIICLVLIIICVFLDDIYINLTPTEINKLRVVFIISSVFAVVNFPCITFTGILNAYEKFISLKIADAFHRIFSVIVTTIVLICNGGLYALVCVHVVTGLLTLIYKFCVIKSQTPIKITFSCRANRMFGDLLGFSMWVTISTLSQRLIFGITPSILGIVSNATVISVFGIVVVMENYIHTITTALNGMFMPQISRIISEQCYTSKLNDLIVRVARFQFALQGLIFTGFLIVGKEFILLWLDNTYISVYYGLLLITLPNLFYYSLQIANTAVMIKNHVKTQAITNIAVGVINVVLSFVWSNDFGVIGACASIFVAYSLRNIGYLIAYKKIIKIDVRKLCVECYIPTLLCMGITAMLGLGINYIITNFNWITLITKIALLIIAYLVLIFFLAINFKERKTLISGFLNKMHLK